MTIFQRLLLVAGVFLSLMQIASAQKATVTQMQACPSQVGDDPSLIALYSAESKTKCGVKDWSLLERIVDARLGVVFYLSRVTISLNAMAVEAGSDDVADTRPTCIRMASDGKSFEEWVVENDAACKHLGAVLGFHRWYGNNRICLIGTYGCILVSDLRPTGQARVKAVYERIEFSRKDLVSKR